MKNQGILSFVIDKYQGDFRNGVCFMISGLSPKLVQISRFTYI